MATEERCVVTELLVDQCAHCRKAPERDVFDDPRRLGPWFDASYPGECAGCGNEFDEGESIRFDFTELGYLAGCCGQDL